MLLVQLRIFNHLEKGFFFFFYQISPDFFLRSVKWNHRGKNVERAFSFKMFPEIKTLRKFTCRRGKNAIYCPVLFSLVLNSFINLNVYVISTCKILVWRCAYCQSDGNRCLQVIFSKLYLVKILRPVNLGGNSDILYSNKISEDTNHLSKIMHAGPISNLVFHSFPVYHSHLSSLFPASPYMQLLFPWKLL